MRFLGYGSIISTSRKQKVLESIQKDSSDCILIVEQWCAHVQSLAWEEMRGDLEKLAQELRWLSIRIEREEQLVYCWPQSEQIEHIQDCSVNHYSLKEGYRCSIYQLAEHQIIPAYARSLQLLILGHVEMCLLRERASLEPCVH